MGLMFIASATASSSATLEFTSGIDSTYNEYQFQFVNMHPQTSSDFKFQVNATDGADFNDSLITSTHFRTWQREDGSEYFFGYSDGHDQAQVAGYQIMINGVDNAADNGCSGVLTLYAPSSTTYVKHFTSRAHSVNGGDYSQDSFSAGYINDTTAIDEISFKFNSGNIDTGTIYMYGVG
jgi:hypothetical protein